MNWTPSSRRLIRVDKIGRWSFYWDCWTFNSCCSCHGLYVPSLDGEVKLYKARWRKLLPIAEHWDARSTLLGYRQLKTCWTDHDTICFGIWRSQSSNHCTETSPLLMMGSTLPITGQHCWAMSSPMHIFGATNQWTRQNNSCRQSLSTLKSSASLSLEISISLEPSTSSPFLSSFARKVGTRMRW